MKESFINTIGAAAVGGIIFAALVGVAIDGVFEDTIHAVKYCAKSLGVK